LSQLPVDLVLFDLTGTVVLDSGAMVVAVKGALSQEGIPFTEADVVSMRGADKRSAFRAQAERTLQGKLSPEALDAMVERALAAFKKTLVEAYTSGPVDPIPGAEATIRWLKERGVKVGATTALNSKLSDIVLGRLGWGDGLFDCKVATDEVPKGRPAPYMIFLAMIRAGVVDVRRVATVGDTPLDLKAGNNAGAGWVVGVLSGVHRLATLGITPHTHILNSVADLPRIFE